MMQFNWAGRLLPVRTAAELLMNDPRLSWPNPSGPRQGNAALSTRAGDFILAQAPCQSKTAEVLPLSPWLLMHAFLPQYE